MVFLVNGRREIVWECAGQTAAWGKLYPAAERGGVCPEAACSAGPLSSRASPTLVSLRSLQAIV